VFPGNKTCIKVVRRQQVEDEATEVELFLPHSIWHLALCYITCLRLYYGGRGHQFEILF